MTPADWAETQMQDQDLSQIIQLYKIKQLENVKLGYFESKEFKTLLCHGCKLTLQDGVLYLKTAHNSDDWNDLGLVLPQVYSTLVMHGCHDDLGHLGTEHMLDLLHDWFYLPTIQDNMDCYLRSFDQCKQFRHAPNEKNCTLSCYISTRTGPHRFLDN